MNSKSIRVTTIGVCAAVVMAVSGPVAFADQAEHRAGIHPSQEAAQAAQAQGEADPLAALEEEGFEERLLDLPKDPSPEQVAKAMYPEDQKAQEAALPALKGSATESAAGKGGPQGVAPSGISWSKAWKVTACVGTIGGFVAGNALLITKAKKYGGVLKGAKLIVQAGNKQERLKILVAMFGEVTGISAVAKSCG
ncbi:hypothetical protein [Streptomyces sp. NRRL B-1347]|uniref:hypothetical protein n=1 Tax=Streptomyces sp. NRRL B-1347 TaxID=1476877 RepID=UPI0004C4E06C|nr:hypothetical protein [Streptomyces sp. NRRL B-1347]